MKSFVLFVQTYVYKSIWKTYEIKIFRTMGAWLETSAKCIFSQLSQCCIPKWQVSFFKTTLHCKKKKVTIKNNKELASHRCSEKYFWIVNLSKSKITSAKVELDC